MKVLAIESSGKVASIALAEDDHLLCEYTTNYKMNHSVTLMPMIQETLNRVQVKKEELDLIAVSSGPGSFTGLRIGAATAKGLAQGLDIPIAAIPTLDAMAMNISCTDHLICPMMDARRNQVYTAIYSYKGSLERITDMMAIGLDEFIQKVNQMNKPIIYLGDGVHVNKLQLEAETKVDYHLASFQHCLQRAGNVARLGIQYAKENKVVSYMDFAPIYLRKSQAEREYEQRKQ